MLVLFVILLVAAAAAIAWTVAFAFLLRRNGRIGRSGRVGLLSLRSGLRLIVTKARSIGRSAARKEALREAYHDRTAEHAVAIMGNMKGALMKMGQMISFMDTGLPDQYRQALSSLQADAPAMDAATVHEAIEMELGAPARKLFAAFDDAPRAAASIGQVHAATLHDGREAVVKVQYPGIDRAIRSDLANVETLYRLFGMVLTDLDPKPLVNEMRARILEELDYENEVANQTAFAALYAGHPFIVVPRPVPEFCAARVLTMERGDGRADELEGLAL